MYGLHAGDLGGVWARMSLSVSHMRRTICRAAMHTVLTLNLRPHISKRSSKLGPSRAMTRMLCRPSWPKWYICGMPAAGMAGRNERLNGRSQRDMNVDTHDSRQVYGMSDTHRATGAPLPCGVPVCANVTMTSKGEISNDDARWSGDQRRMTGNESQHRRQTLHAGGQTGRHGRTNLMATV